MSKKIKLLMIGILIGILFICISPLIFNLCKLYIHVNDFTNSIYVMGIDTYPSLLESLLESKKTKIEYWEVNDFNNARRTKKFIPDDAIIYTSYSCIEIDNIIDIDSPKCIIYKNDDESEKTTEITDIYNKVSKSTDGSWIIEEEFKIFEIDDNYYVFAPLNVNMHTPVYFFKYNKKSKELRFLYQLENIDVTGIKVKK